MENKLFQTIKKSIFERSQNWNLSKGLTQDFGQKLDILQILSLKTKWVKAMCSVIFYLEKKPFTDYIKRIFEWWQNQNFSKGLTHDFKNWKTVNCFLLDKIVKRNVFGNVSNDKPPTLNYKS